MTILILFTVLAIIIPSVAVIEWANYESEEEAYIASLRAQVGIGIAEEEPSSAIRRYSDNYINELEKKTEADVRMRQANMFYEMGVQW